MKIAITGATGFVGQNIVPLLEAAGHCVVLFGRDQQKLEQYFPGRIHLEYGSKSKLVSDSDYFLHLAVLNNDQVMSRSGFDKVNVDFTLDIADYAKKCGVKKFIFVSSFHAFEDTQGSFYTQSKRLAVAKLQTVENLDLTVLYLPLVYAEQWSGKLAWLNRLPPAIANLAFRPLAALKPTLHVSTLAKFLNSERPENSFNEILICDDISRNRYYTAIKKIMDLLAGGIIIFGLSWLIFIIWCLIKLDSPGPGIFAQERVGFKGQVFTCYKLRTMKSGTLQRGTHEMTSQDVTRLGRFLRRFKLDELPQAINLLVGNMSLIGPRPCLPSQKHLIEEREKLSVFELLPGITGLSQVRNIDMSNPAKLAKSDSHYAKMRGLLLDIKIILATVRGRGFGDSIS